MLWGSASLSVGGLVVALRVSGSKKQPDNFRVRLLLIYELLLHWRHLLRIFCLGLVGLIALAVTLIRLLWLP